MRAFRRILLLAFAVSLCAVTAFPVSVRAESAGEASRICAAGKDLQKAKDKKAYNECVQRRVASARDTTGDNKDPVSGQEVKKTSVLGYIDSAYKWAAVIGGLLAVLMLTYAGYRYMTSYGDPEKIADAKNLIEQALIGLALLILAAVILQTINPNTLGCKTNCGDIDFSQPSGSFNTDKK